VRQNQLYFSLHLSNETHETAQKEVHVSLHLSIAPQQE
jgi:hypothetical protein